MLTGSERFGANQSTKRFVSITHSSKNKQKTCPYNAQWMGKDEVEAGH